jgi:hypothetical protein
MVRKIMCYCNYCVEHRNRGSMKSFVPPERGLLVSTFRLAEEEYSDRSWTRALVLAFSQLSRTLEPGSKRFIPKRSSKLRPLRSEQAGSGFWCSAAMSSSLSHVWDRCLVPCCQAGKYLCAADRSFAMVSFHEFGETKSLAFEVETDE